MTAIHHVHWVLIALVAGFCGCAEEKTDQLSPRSDVVVVLPPTPDLNPPEVVTKHPDGVFTVAGLVADRSNSLDQMIQVRGNVASPHTCEGDKDCHPRPHFLLRDGKDGRNSLLVAGWSNQTIKGLEEGQELTLDGRFGLVSPDGLFIRQTGLLMVDPTSKPNP